VRVFGVALKIHPPKREFLPAKHAKRREKQEGKDCLLNFGFDQTLKLTDGYAEGSVHSCKAPEKSGNAFI
jgi:hypothetical protein